MAERNQRKHRKCSHCSFSVVGKASELKAHGRTCMERHRAAAAEAIMDKLKQDMADERLLNAEGD